MPHFVIEYTLNAKALLPADCQENWKPLYQKFHSIMQENGAAPVAKCKSRAYMVDNFLLGDDEEAGFVHLTLSFLDPPSGPFTPEKMRSLGDALKAAMVEFFGGPGKTGKVEFSAELRIMPMSLYWRHG